MLKCDLQPTPIQSKENQVSVLLKESDHMVELRQANVVKNWTDKHTVSQNLPDFIAGLNRIGSFNLTGAEQPLVTKPDGTKIADPRDAILVGSANETDTLEFILSRIFEMDVSGMRLGKSDEGSIKLYSQYREKLEAIMRARHAQEANDLDDLKGKMSSESKSLDEYKERLHEWSFSTGSYFVGEDGFNPQQLAKDKETLPIVRTLISNLSAGATLS